jgi:hypothetical protein
MHFLPIKLKDLSLPKVRYTLASVFELKGISNILATKSSTKKSHVDSKNKSIKDNQSLVTLFLTDEIVHTVVELSTANCNDIRHASLMLVNKLQCLLGLFAGASYSVAPTINCHSHLRNKW